MTDLQHKAQLTEVSRGVFATKGSGAASMEEVTAATGVSKPIVYEHSDTRERLYQAVIDQEMKTLEIAIKEALSLGRSHYRVEQTVLVLLTYVEESPEGFSVISRDSGVVGGYETLLSDVTKSVTPTLAEAFKRADFGPAMLVPYGDCMVGIVSQTVHQQMGRHGPDRKTVATHIANLCWNGLAGMGGSPTLHGSADVPAAAEGAKFEADVAAGPMQVAENG